ncbi:hypothetical protein ACP4OV_001209 [Aristida adscensionis]
MEQEQEQVIEGIVIAGAGLAGLATALRLHRKGVRCLVLKSSPTLRASGFALTTWKNAFRALDALGVGDKLRKQHLQPQASLCFSPTRCESFLRRANEVRCIKRDLLLQALEEELPRGTIRYSSRIVSIEEDSNVKILHLADGSILKAKVLIGCDGINSVVAKSLGLAKPSYLGRSEARGIAHFPDGHCFEHKFVGHGFSFGMLPCNDTDV